MVSKKKNVLILLSLIQLNFILPAENFSDEKETVFKPEQKINAESADSIVFGISFNSLIF